MLTVPDQVPVELENRLERQKFEETVQTLSNLYAEAQKRGVNHVLKVV